MGDPGCQRLPAGRVRPLRQEHRPRRAGEHRARVHQSRAVETNLCIRTDTVVTKVLLEGRRARGVGCSPDGGAETFRAEGEVILAAGAFHSPQLLMLSGIGPADHLRDHRITVAHELPGLGANLQDHLEVHMQWRVDRRHHAQPLHPNAREARGRRPVVPDPARGVRVDARRGRRLHAHEPTGRASQHPVPLLPLPALRVAAEPKRERVLRRCRHPARAQPQHAPPRLRPIRRHLRSSTSTITTTRATSTTCDPRSPGARGRVSARL